MLFSTLTILVAALGAVASPVPVPDADAAVAPLVERQSACTAYTIINTRGTGEPQGESSGFRTMNQQITSQVRGGTIYNTRYAAGFSQNSAAGTRDILSQIDTTLRRDPGHCFILQGYSQGAAATVNAIDQISESDPRFNAVRGVFLIGSPMRRAGLACNVDTNGGTRTRNVNGISRALGRIPERWVAKSLDVCNFVSVCGRIAGGRMSRG